MEQKTSRKATNNNHERSSKGSIGQIPFSDVIKEMNAEINQKEEEENKDPRRKSKIGFESSTASEMFDDFRCESADSGWDTDLEDDLHVSRAKHDATGEKVYLKTCKDLNIIPSNHVISCFSKPVLNVRHRAIGPREIKSIADALLCNTFVKVLDLEDNNIGASGISQVLRLLIENCFITEVSLSQNNLGSRVAEIFCHILKNTRTLTKVNLSGNKFGDKDCCKLAEGMILNDTVKILSLSHNEFRSAAGQDLGMALSKNFTLTHLDLSWNHLRMDGAVALANGLAKNSSLEVLNLSFNGFSDNGAEAMGHALATNTTLKDLDLSYNRISDKGAFALSKGLAKNTALQKLNISYNPITKDGGLSLLVAASNAKELIELLMEEIFLDTRAMDLIAELLKSRGDFIVTYSGVSNNSGFGNQKNEIRLLKKKIFNLIRNYLKEKKLRMVDLFNRWDKDKSLSLSREEFRDGIAAANIPLSPEMINFLVDQLDADGNGSVGYDEFVAIYGIE